jgi:hypothetical protein
VTVDSFRTITPQYLAGLFDGEGCIDVQVMYPTANDRLYVRPRMRMCMSMSTFHVGEELHTLFGGHLTFCKATSSKQRASWSLEWLSKDDMYRLNGVIGPYLILKREQLRLVIWWLDNMSGRQTKQPRFSGMEKARAKFVEELRAMKADPQRLSERFLLRCDSPNTVATS